MALEPSLKAGDPWARNATDRLHLFRVLVAAAFLGLAIWMVVPVRFPALGLSFPLVWADQILDGVRPDFSQTTDTPHPLGNALALALGVLPGSLATAGIAAQMFVLGLYISLVTSVAYVVGGRLACVLTFVILVSRGNLLGTGMLLWNDTIFACFVLGAWHAMFRGRDRWALGLLAVAGLQRPEGWICVALLAAYLVRRDRDLALFAGGAVVVAPIVWMVHDQALTGEWLFSVTHTSTYAQELNRLTGVSGALSLPARVRDVVGFIPMVLVLIGLVTLVVRGARARECLLALTATAGTLLFILLGAPAHGRYFLVLIGLGVAYGVVGLLALARSRGPGIARFAGIAISVSFAVAVAVQLPDRASEIQTLRSNAQSEARVWRTLQALAPEASRACTPLSVNTARLYTSIPLISAVRQRDLRVDPGTAAVGVFHADPRTLRIIGFESDRPTSGAPRPRRGWFVSSECR